MRIIGRLLEATLAVTFIFGLLLGRSKHSGRRRDRRALSFSRPPGRDTYVSGYTGATGWDGYVVPPSSSPARQSDPRAGNRLHRRRRQLKRLAEQADEPAHQTVRRLARLRRIRKKT